MKPAISPGEILLEEYLKPMEISQNAMARAIRVPPRAVNEIVLGKRAITPAMSIRFGAFFGQSETFWHGLQVECDFRALSNEKNEITNGIKSASDLTGRKSQNIFPKYSNEEFKAEVLKTFRRLRELHHESLRNPTQPKVAQLLHSLRIIVDSLASPVTEFEGTDSENSYSRYREGLLGSGQSRKKYNEHFHTFAGRRWTWPCNVEIHKGLAGLTFRREKNNDSPLEVHLASIGLGKGLLGRETSYNKSAGTTYRDKNGKLEVR